MFENFVLIRSAASRADIYMALNPDPPYRSTTLHQQHISPTLPTVTQHKKLSSLLCTGSFHYDWALLSQIRAGVLIA
jgi:hypothetical protein